MATENGGKIELKLGPTTPEGAEYDATLEIPGATFHGKAQVGAKLVTFVWDGGTEPPEWVLADARAALRAALRTSQAEGKWPRRLTRWRPEPTA
jgi:hypothetical protein